MYVFFLKKEYLRFFVKVFYLWISEGFFEWISYFISFSIENCAWLLLIFTLFPLNKGLRQIPLIKILPKMSFFSIFIFLLSYSFNYYNKIIIEPTTCLMKQTAIKMSKFTEYFRWKWRRSTVTLLYQARRWKLRTI